MPVQMHITWLVNCYQWCSLNLDCTVNWVKAVSVPIHILVSHFKCSQRSINEVCSEHCGWSSPFVLDDMTHRAWCSGKISIAVTYCSVSFSWVIARHGPHSKVWLCRSWQGDDWHCSSHVVPVNSPSLLLPEPERRIIEGAGVMGRQEGVLVFAEPALPPQNTLRVTSPFLCLSFQTQTQQSTAYLSHMGSAYTSAIRFCLRCTGNIPKCSEFKAFGASLADWFSSLMSSSFFQLYCKILLLVYFTGFILMVFISKIIFGNMHLLS